ncbi:MAG TPA: hypothetical protein VD763_05590 [Candidatus Saccharimonadales bacterium]|nr:hypothetical protein [Candidatus Saccharimonadales bacterium]
MSDRPAAPRPLVRLIVASLLAALVAAGCGGGSLGALQGLASLDPGPTALPSGGAPTSVVPSQGAVDAAPQDAAIAAFVEDVASGDMSYRMSFKGRTALSITVLKIAGRMDVEGKDFASSFTYESGKDVGLGKIRMQVRAVKGKAYAKIGGSKWVTLTGYREADTNVPFHAIETVRDVAYLGTEERKGKTVHRISIPEARLIDPSGIPLVISQERIRRTTLELLIDDAGKPAAGTWELDGQARVGGSGQLQQLLIELDLTFSKVGSDLSIKKP